MSKNFEVHSFWAQKDSEGKNNLGPINFGSKEYWVKKCGSSMFVVKKNLGLKNIGSKKIQGPKIFESKNSDSKKVWFKKNWCQK